VRGRDLVTGKDLVSAKRRARVTELASVTAQ
jgi:hypothetical protein